MFNIAEKPIQSTNLGHPVMLGEIVGRIVGYPEDVATIRDAFGDIEYARVLVGTPHGSVISAGRFHVSEISEEGMEKLLNYEEELRYDFKPLYNGKLDDFLPKDTETLTAKLRNALSPAYGLAQMILLTEENQDKKEDMWELLVEAAKQAEKQQERIDKILSKLEEQKT
jgi:hypothetical protein